MLNCGYCGRRWRIGDNRTVSAILFVCSGKSSDHLHQRRRIASELQISIACPSEFTVDSGWLLLLPDRDRAATPGQKILVRVACGNSS